MELGLKKDEVRLAEYTPEWADEFQKVREEICLKTGLSTDRIEHIGSTAILGMPAKPIIDLLVGIDDLKALDKQIISSLKECGFLRLKVERPGEIVFAKYTDTTYEVKTHFIHMVDYQQDLWKDLTFFRDYLNANETARQQYLTIKLAYLENGSTGINEYTAFKEEFVRGIFKNRQEK
ncbi:dephospho-CoA kinase [Bacillus sp. FJAT-18017]|uniref:GrpB family protein n=1 Tax=Bacillus sp. FJAT-18017 TaxID=1705566 RepID=UPI0006AF121E|nr:GrpB family protein [Bacillus sp. FJAT-18017]ALC91294.1 dephospho-CoA kinase [Bacillus sp. FJAT-18017]